MSVLPKGQCYVICAPSGTGKSTLLRRLRREYPAARFSVSHTTRQPRSGETHGEDYFFTSRKEFEKKIRQGFFAEWAEVHGNLYGTPLEFTAGLMEQGQDVLFDIDVQGARQLKESLPAACLIMILPPSRKDLVSRLEARGTDDRATIDKRLDNAAKELVQAPLFDYWIVNDDLDRAYEDLRAVYLARKLAPDRDPELVERLLNQWDNNG
ncbi:guanylate kinase [Desulfohalovibrio reitneri]|uniref:guanylate kinase n=1 Tax=Desulfohalovibrio reitneri TaxID=1307759 RepID=UPI0004A7734E|nr:guanylate kinase [Desulfohalovibrio reitneri]